MQAYHLPREETIGLRRIIELERTREESLPFITRVVNALIDPNDLNPMAMIVRNTLAENVSGNLINTVNSVYLDNLMRFVTSKDPMSFVTGMQNGTLGMMMEVGHRHYSELLNEISSEYENEQEVKFLLGNYINYIYCNNKEQIDVELLKIFEILYTNFSHMQVNTSRFVFSDNGRPTALITGGMNAFNQAY